MAYQTSADDFDEAEERAREDSMLSELASFQPQPPDDRNILIDYASQYAPEEPTLAGVPEHDAAEAQRAAAQSQLINAAATAPKPTAGAKIGEFLGDNAVGILGTFLDAAVNKGRNIPGILTAGAAAADQSAARRAAEENRTMDFMLRAQSQRAQGQRAAEQAERDRSYKTALQQHWNVQATQAARNAENREKQTQLGRDRFEAERNPNDPNAVAMRGFLRARGITDPNIDKMGIVGMRMAQPALATEFDEFYSDTQARLAAKQAEAQASGAARGRLRVEIQLAPEIARMEAEQAGAIAAAQAEARKRAEEALSSGRVLPGTVVRDETAYKQSGTDPKSRGDMIAIAGGAKTSVDALKRMRALRARHGTELFGANKTAYDMAQVNVNTGLTQIGSTGTLTDGERKYYMGMVPGMSASFEDVPRLLPGQPDTKLKMIDAAIKAFEQMADSRLYLYGVGLDHDAPLPEDMPKGRPHGAPAAAPAGRNPNKRPGQTLMRNPATGTVGWVDDANVQDKINRLKYERVQ